MKIVFNTGSPDAAASLFYAAGMKPLPGIAFGDYGHYPDYDVALFMTYDADLLEMRRARAANPKLKIGLIDARGSKVLPYLDVIDFFVLDSIEMEDFWAGYNRPIFIYPDIPTVPMIEKKHVNKGKIIIGYHGNRAHLGGMFPEISSALDLLGKTYELELLAVYNMRQGKNTLGLPLHVPVRHVQWHEKVYEQELAESDIGICPALMPIANLTRIKHKASVSAFFADNDDDYLVRYKMPSNDGRAAIFGFLGIPVVADMLPSYLQLIEHGKNGFIAMSRGGYYQCLKKLIDSPDLRDHISATMRKRIVGRFDFNRINREFLSFLGSLEPSCHLRPLEDSAIHTEQEKRYKRELGKISRKLFFAQCIKSCRKLIP